MKTWTILFLGDSPPPVSVKAARYSHYGEGANITWRFLSEADEVVAEFPHERIAGVVDSAAMA